MTDLAGVRNNRGISISGVQTGDKTENIKEDLNRHLHTTLAKDFYVATDRDYYLALANAVWERLSTRWLRTQQQQYLSDRKRVYYLSLEFYMGRSLSNAMLNLGISDSVQQALYDIEEPDDWLRYGNPWERQRQELATPVHFYGRVQVDNEGQRRWVDCQTLFAVPYDTPVPGYMTNTCNTLRLWACRAPRNFDFSIFNTGDYINVSQMKVKKVTFRDSS
ncbi:Alpha-1 4 glucan phosphorylase [Fasciola gigantica]|uniref:Alpha-1,4 glucan phosphorylase n=1 Tax=Fasciola gigantica TaxID=46835 RepID=A0A504YD57_FASGI|nr:Alpha-1 4 glucan phosphorylase [Fasciola gigantica]